MRNPLLSSAHNSRGGSFAQDCSVDIPSVKPAEGISIYQLYPQSSKTGILWAGGFIALLTPFTDTVYLPALSSIISSFYASDSEVNATVSAYLFAAAIGQLVWGTLSDHYGRQKILYAGLFFYELVTVGCIFANDIYTLIALRSLEGFLVGSSLVTVQAIISDVFPRDELGKAMGAFLVSWFCCIQNICGIYCSTTFDVEIFNY